MGRKKKDVMDEVLAFLSSRGVDTKELPTESDKYDYRNNDAVVVFVNTPTHFKPGICKNCKKPFAVNKASVGFCSDICRREDWTKTTGLPWRAVSTNDVWNGDPPMIISPAQMKKLEAIVDWFNKNRTSLVLAPESESDNSDLEALDSLESLETLVPASVDSGTVYRDSHTSPQSEPFDEVLEQTLLEEDLFGFS